MAVVVSLKDIVDAMDEVGSEWESYLNPETGEIVTVTDEDQIALESHEPEENLPEWQREDLSKVRRALESGQFIQLPDQFDIHEWSIMERFCLAVRDEARREELLDAIHGRGAFRHFRSTIERLGITDKWYDFRYKELEQIAKDWLEDHEIPYK